MLNVTYAECHYKECRYAESRGATYVCSMMTKTVLQHLQKVVINLLVEEYLDPTEICKLFSLCP